MRLAALVTPLLALIATAPGMAAISTPTAWAQSSTAGDADCSGSVTLVDAMLLAQVVSGTRAAVRSCPLDDPAGQANVAGADLGADGLDATDLGSWLACALGLPVTCEPASGGFEFVEGKDATPLAQDWTKPDPGDSYVDPAYGLEIRRLTSAQGSRFDRNDYSRRQAENADGSAFMTYHGDTWHHVYDRESLEPLSTRDLPAGSQPQWHPTDPDRLRHVGGSTPSRGDLRYHELDLSTGVDSVIADITDRVQAEYPTAQYMHDRFEGSPSADGNRHAWMIYDANENPLGFVHYDLATDEILGFRDLEPDPAFLDWVSTSPTGEYVIAGYHHSTIVYDADLTNPRELIDHAQHSDIGLSAEGADTYVYMDYGSGPDGGWLVAIDLATLERTRLFFIWDGSSTSMHVSTKNFGRPGWALISTYDCHQEFAWTCQKIMAVELGGDHTILNLAHTYNCGGDYWTQTHGSVNGDFSRVYFNSDGGFCGRPAEVYEIAVPGLPDSPGS